MHLQTSKGFTIINDWLKTQKYQPFDFQTAAWQHILNGKSGLINAPTGCGKTYSIFLGSLIQFINQHPVNFTTQKNNGLQLLWITPLRALAKDIGRAMEEVIAALQLQWKVGIRNGDTTTAERLKQKKQIPEILIITPESLQLLLAQKKCDTIFETVQVVAIDEWHELIGSKRGVQVELALSRICGCVNALQKQFVIWGISATIGNLQEAKEVLLSPLKIFKSFHKFTIESIGETVKANMDKQIQVYSIIPEEIEKYPWAGHLGIKLAEQIVPIIEASTTTLIFINTRGMSEMWYQKLLEVAPQFAGSIALHHGSMEQELRQWVEDALHTKKLKAVVCTASLDLGVDFRPVDTVIQVGSPKGVSRFLQRAGRSGHKPGDISKIYFLPTHSLELIESAALQQALQQELTEAKDPLLLCFDVLTQYLCTLAVGDGFTPNEIFNEIKNTYCFADCNWNEFNEVLLHITIGGKAFQQYDEYKKVEVENGVYQIKSKRIAMRHRMHIGTIVSDAMMKVKFLTGGYIGHIEEWFISKLEPGDVFTLGGKNVELVLIKDMIVLVKKSTSKKSQIPSWMGGRMSLTANLGKVLRETFNLIPPSLSASIIPNTEIAALKPLFQLQQQLSHIPLSNELLIEKIETKDGFHVLVYPFEGRQIHEAMSALLAYRISNISPITFSIAMNDYGFELLSDQPIPINNDNLKQLFSTNNLLLEIQKSVNNVEMAARKFRDIAVIGGLIFQGMPGEQKKARHLQSSASLIFKVLSEYDSNNLLLRQAYNEVLSQQMEEARLRLALQRIEQSNIIITIPTKLTPLSFPIIVDGLNRNNLTSEKLEDRVKKMQLQLAKS
jgi:ATP-dependent helicase Lhr and Lhr-like helicase